MVFTPTSKAELKTAVNKWWTIANSGYGGALESANTYSGSEYQGNPNTWDVSNITDMSYLFNNLPSAYLNSNFLDLTTWDTSNVTSMESMFDAFEWAPYEDGPGFTLALNTHQVTVNEKTYTAWDVSSVQNMSSMFNTIQIGFIDMSNWDVSSVQNMSKMFANNGLDRRTYDFSSWDTSSVTDMSSMFSNTQSGMILSPLTNWDTSKVTDMSNLFYFGPEFDGAININTQKVTSNGKTYTAWDVSKVQNMSGMFWYIQSYKNMDLSNWDTSSVTDMSNMFNTLNSRWQTFSILTPINLNTKVVTVNGKTYTAWDVSKVTDMSNMFLDCGTFNSDIGNWDTSSVTDMNNMFNCSLYFTFIQRSGKFNQNINYKKVSVGGNTYAAWDTSKVTDMSNMFAYTNFDQNIRNWIVGENTNLYWMFQSAGFADGRFGFTTPTPLYTQFNVPLPWSPESKSELQTGVNKWYSIANDGSTNAVENANSYNDTEYKGNPNTWAVHLISDMSELFEFQTGDNHPDINTWDTSNVTDMSSMFQY